MAPDIDVASGGKPRCRRIMMIGNAQRDVVVTQQIQDIVLVPAWVTKFECVRPPGAKQLEERAQPLAILLELRRQLEQHRPRLVAQQPQA